ncbi:type VI secretion system-associated protein TagF [Sphingomonas sp. 1P06PA]|uniref:type VI secretion system-associated protein TagF n=1 Tax=Sphingomonas sp. 1P06PA TaxID=554121 RepID=UPI0039A682DF
MLFGKLPAHGDFVSRGILPSTRNGLDQWLAGEIADARATFATDFEARYDRAPPWRFAVEGGEGWIAGAIAPSVDAVGRRFPLLVAASADLESAAGVAAVCEDLIYAAFGDGWDADRLHAALRAVTASDQAGAPRAGWWLADEGGTIIERLDGERPSGLIRAMLAEREIAG